MSVVVSEAGSFNNFLFQQRHSGHLRKVSFCIGPPFAWNFYRLYNECTDLIYKNSWADVR